MTPAGVLEAKAEGGRALDLVDRARARDREAFEMLVEQHAAPVYRLAAGDDEQNKAFLDEIMRGMEITPP